MRIFVDTAGISGQDSPALASPDGADPTAPPAPFNNRLTDAPEAASPVTA